jgi:HemY protein
MMRIVAFFVVIALVALGATWIADRPGEVVMTWQHWRISTSITVAVVAFAVAVLFAMFVWTVIRFIMKSPDLVALFFRERRRAKGWRAITHGLIAVGTGNLALARRSATDARKFAGDNPLTLLLAAQAAQLGGDIEKAEGEFRAMLGNAETKLLGLRGLYIEAVRRNDAASAHAYAREATQSQGAPAWAAEALIEFQCRAGDWAGALTTLEAASAARTVNKSIVKRQRAVLLTAQALSIEETDPARARELGIEAANLAPDLVPAAALAGRLLGVNGSLRKAANIIERAWAVTPHPDLAQAYAYLRPGDSAADRLKRVKRLTKKKSGHSESVLAVARAAFEANHFEEARALLVPLLADPTQRTCLLMAEIEATEHGDHGKAREWTVRALRAKRDPAWVADGYVSDQWLPASPQTGRLDAFTWMVPQSGSDGLVLEQAAEQVLAAPIPLAVRETTPPLPEKMPAALTAEKPRVEKRSEAVAPLVAEPPLPDDPGPEIEEIVPTRRRFRLFDWLNGPAA